MYPLVARSTLVAETINWQVVPAVDTGEVPNSPFAVAGSPAVSVPKYRQYPFSPDPPLLSAPAVQLTYGDDPFVQAFEDILVPPFERVMATAEALVLGAVVSVVKPMETWGRYGTSLPPKVRIALTEIF